MLKQSVIDKIPKVDYYVTGGQCFGRILACKKPYDRGNGVYHLSMDLNQWQVQGDRTMSETQLIDAIEQIRDSKAEVLREAVRLNEHLGIDLIEDPKWVFQIVQKQ